MLNYTKIPDKILCSGHTVFFHLYKFNTDKNRKLLLVPGSRLGGVETWEALTPYLQEWSEIIIVEIRGAGSLNSIDTAYSPHSTFTRDDLLNDILRIVEKNHWQQFDLISYSFGGYLSMLLKQKYPEIVQNHVLLESALLAETDENLDQLANELEHIAQLVLSDTAAANTLFTKLVNPHARQFQIKTSDYRPIHNPAGFSNLMMILCDAYRNSNRWALIKDQGKITSILTEYAPTGAHQMAEQIQKKFPLWKFEYIAQENHSMLFVKPEWTANLLNKLPRRKRTG
jgi:pimeloyl-ACP methyl ester carboxylesterase